MSFKQGQTVYKTAAERKLTKGAHIKETHRQAQGDKQTQSQKKDES